MRILITNDDGIQAPGIAALYRCLEGLGERFVVAPARHQSASGHALTVREPLRVQTVRVPLAFEGYAVEGRPADCVKLALTHLLADKPDLIVSGINDGANTGLNVLYSGTVAAATVPSKWRMRLVKLAGFAALAVGLALLAGIVFASLGG